MPNSPCGLCLKVSLPPILMQFTDAGLAIPVVGLGPDSDGVQAPAARAMVQRVAIFGRCMSINRHVFNYLNQMNSIVSIY
jgi:hypothetical protein